MTQARMRLVLLAACILGSAQAQGPTTAPANLAGWPQVSSEVTRSPDIETRIERLLAAMSDREKVGQMIQAELASVSPDDIREYGIGSVLNGGGSFPDGDKAAPASAWVAKADAFWRASMDSRDGRTAIPVIWGTDSVHGHNNVRGATLFPHNIGLGATRNPALVEAIARATALEVAATGLDWSFSPTLAVARDLRWGRAYESFSEDPQIVASFAGALVRGLQGSAADGTLFDKGRLIATAKHFIGDGGTRGGVDQGDTVLDEEALRTLHGLAYVEALAAGVQTVMASFSSWNGDKMHGHRYLLTEVLKGRMGFDGFVIGDWNGHAQIPGCTASDCLAAIEAGVDMIMVPQDWKAFHTTTLAHLRAGRLAPDRVDDAVRRILRVKLRAGLFESVAPSERPYAGRQDLLAAPAHRVLAREAVRQSLVLLKKDKGLLPLKPHQRILLAGDGANDMSMQSGGWTLTWQGDGNQRSDFPNGETIGEAILAHVQSAGGQVELSADGSYSQRPDVAIVVTGETPYAEGRGDIGTLEFQPGDKTALALLKKLSADGIPVATVFLSGRPLWVNAELNASNAFVAAWLPGSEGGGVADLLFADENGTVRHPFTGRLPFSWPLTAEAASAERRTTEDGERLFPVGFGLEGGQDGGLRVLSEAGMAPAQGRATLDGSEDVTLFDGVSRGPWRLVVGDSAGWEVPGHGPNVRTEGDPPLRMSLTDRRLQGDGRQVSWPGDQPAAVLLSSREPIDLTPFARAEGVLVFDLRIDSNRPEHLVVRMECGWPCSGEVDLAPVLTTPSTNQWRTISIDLACFSRAGSDLSRSERPFVLFSQSRQVLSFANVRLSRFAAKSADIACQGDSGAGD